MNGFINLRKIPGSRTGIIARVSTHFFSVKHGSREWFMAPLVNLPAGLQVEPAPFIPLFRAASS